MTNGMESEVQGGRLEATTPKSISTSTRAHQHTIPPHIAWPAFVIFLLLLSVFVSFAALWAANSDGGAILVREPTEQFVP